MLKGSAYALRDSQRITETPAFKEKADYLLEEEVVFDELLLVGGGHALEWVELALEVASELTAGLDDLVHDLVALGVGDTGSEWDVSEVAADTDSGGLDHGSVLLLEGRSLEAISGHLGDVLGIDAMAVVLLDDWVEELVELGVSLVGASVDTDAGVDVLAATEDADLEGHASFAGHVFVLVPDLLGEVLAQEGLGALWEKWEVSQVVDGLEPVAAVGASINWSWLLHGVLAVFG